MSALAEKFAAFDVDGSGTLTAEEVLAIDQALTRLAAKNERLARVVECRFFAGLGEEETAEALGIAHGTVSTDWRTVRAWLSKELELAPD